MNFEEIQQHLQPENIGRAPNSVKFSILILIFILIIGVGLYYDTNKQFTQLKSITAKETELKSEFTVKADRAAKLDLYKDQLTEMRISLGALLRQLPEKIDIESLLVDISQTGLANGLEVRKFQPNPEEKKDFYAELPINLEVSGSFHQLASFISDVSALPRIVTISNLNLALADNGRINMSAVAKTYRYLQEDEQ